MPTKTQGQAPIPVPSPADASLPDTSPASHADLPGPVLPRRKLVIPLGRGAHGKTYLVRWMIERAMQSGRDHIIADADPTNATLANFYGDVMRPPSADEDDRREWLKALFDRLIEGPAGAAPMNAVLDLGAGDLLLKQLARDLDLGPFLAGYGLDAVAVHMIGGDPDDLSYLRDTEENGLFAPPATILVLNEGLVPRFRSTEAAFLPVLQHPTFKAALDRGARSVHMPRLDVAHEVDSRRLTFAAAVDGRVKPGQKPIGPVNRQLVSTWLRTMEQRFKPVAEWLL